MTSGDVSRGGGRPLQRREDMRIMYRATVKKARERLARVQARRKAEASKTKIILIVDDDAESVALVESIGRKAGYQVIGAESGEACLAMLPRIAPHLIMLDVN